MSTITASGKRVSFSVCCKAQNMHFYFLLLHGKETVLLDESSGRTQARKLETRLQIKQVDHQQEELPLNLPRENPVLGVPLPLPGKTSKWPFHESKTSKPVLASMVVFCMEIPDPLALGA